MYVVVSNKIIEQPLVLVPTPKSRGALVVHDAPFPEARCRERRQFVECDGGLALPGGAWNGRFVDARHRNGFVRFAQLAIQEVGEMRLVGVEEQLAGHARPRLEQVALARGPGLPRGEAVSQDGRDGRGKGVANQVGASGGIDLCARARTAVGKRTGATGRRAPQQIDSPTGRQANPTKDWRS